MAKYGSLALAFFHWIPTQKEVSVSFSNDWILAIGMGPAIPFVTMDWIIGKGHTYFFLSLREFNERSLVLQGAFREQPTLPQLYMWELPTFWKVVIYHFWKCAKIQGTILCPVEKERGTYLQLYGGGTRNASPLKHRCTRRLFIFWPHHDHWHVGTFISLPSTSTQ